MNSFEALVNRGFSFDDGLRPSMHFSNFALKFISGSNLTEKV